VLVILTLVAVVDGRGTISSILGGSVPTPTPGPELEEAREVTGGAGATRGGEGDGSYEIARLFGGRVDDEEEDDCCVKMCCIGLDRDLGRATELELELGPCPCPEPPFGPKSSPGPSPLLRLLRPMVATPDPVPSSSDNHLFLSSSSSSSPCLRALVVARPKLPSLRLDGRAVPACRCAMCGGTFDVRRHIRFDNGCISGLGKWREV
jgi:hypothetical protein